MKKYTVEYINGMGVGEICVYHGRSVALELDTDKFTIYDDAGNIKVLLKWSRVIKIEIEKVEE